MAYSKEFLDEMKKRLLQEQTDLQADLSKFAKKHGSGYETRFQDSGDVYDENAQEVTEYTNELPLTNTLEMQLEKVNVALAKIEDGSYGNKNGEFISEARLEANPAAGSCID